MTFRPEHRLNVSPYYSICLTRRQHQQAVITKIKPRGENSRLRNRRDIDSIKSLMWYAESAFAVAGLHQLEDAACTLLQELRRHGPGGPPLTRLLDNLYGRVWETTFNAALVDDMPPKVIESAHTVRDEFAQVVKQLSVDLGRIVHEKFVNLVKDRLPRLWSDKDDRLQKFIHLDSPTREQFVDFLRMPTTTGHEANGDYFVALTLFDVFKEASPNHFHWIQAASSRYRNEILPLKGETKFREPSNERRVGSGITLAHQFPTSFEQASMRVALNRVWDLDVSRESDVVSVNMLSLNRGVSYGTGISDYTHLFASFFSRYQGQKGPRHLARNPGDSHILGA
jgi:hypothetical protein